jgi:hypothetical protein
MKVIRKPYYEYAHDKNDVDRSNFEKRIFADYTSFAAFLDTPDPVPGKHQQLTFSCVNEYEGFRNRLTAYAAVNTIAINTSAGDVTTTAPVDYIDFAITDAYGLRVGSMTIESDSGITSSPNVDKAEKERCEALAKYLFGTGLTFTTFAHGEQQ